MRNWRKSTWTQIRFRNDKNSRATVKPSIHPGRKKTDHVNTEKWSVFGSKLKTYRPIIQVKRGPTDKWKNKTTSG